MRVAFEPSQSQYWALAYTGAALSGDVVIDDLDESLKALLVRELPAAISGQISVSFAAPDDEFHSSVRLPAVDLFLYDVRENLELRSNDEFVERDPDGTGTRTRSPVRVDASYLITAWPGSTEKDRPEDEHHLLGEVMQARRSDAADRGNRGARDARQQLPGGRLVGPRL